MRSLTHKTTLTLLILLWLWPMPCQSEEPLDLVGTWFVLIHYTDPETANPEATRWKDLVWVFARKGSRLEWTEYPLVIFEDQTGRFEKQYRVLAAWEPTPAQLKTLENGPRVNDRGARRKSLRGSDAQGWTSAGRRPRSSANVMSYQETVKIQDLMGHPLFERSDGVGSAMTSEEAGATLYQVTEIKPGQRRMMGKYQRDERLKGRFEMRRTRPVRGLKKKEATPNERAAEAFKKTLESENQAPSQP